MTVLLIGLFCVIVLLRFVFVSLFVVCGCVFHYLCLCCVVVMCVLLLFWCGVWIVMLCCGCCLCLCVA